MEPSANESDSCKVRGKIFSIRMLIPGTGVRDAVVGEIRKEHPGWSAEKFTCQPDPNPFPDKCGYSLLESEKSELTCREGDVLRSLKDHDVLSQNIESVVEEKWPYDERLAFCIAAFGRS